MENKSSLSAVQPGEIRLLRVVSVETVGVFLGLDGPKDLFLPFAEQTEKLRVGDEVLIYVYLDNNQRLCASMRVESFLQKTAGDLKEEQAVQLVLLAETDLGYKVAIDGRYVGILYGDEVFQKVHYGQQLKGFVKKLRHDGKIDLKLIKAGHRAAQDLGGLILEKLQQSTGFLDLNEKTPPERIYELFGVSKKKYKMALGALYKKRQIRIEDDGIHLIGKDE